MQKIKMQVRIETTDSGEERLIAFWRESGQLCCFTWQDGHNVASECYRLNLPMASNLGGKSLIEKMQRYYDSLPGERVQLELVQRLPRQ